VLLAPWLVASFAFTCISEDLQDFVNNILRCAIAFIVLGMGLFLLLAMTMGNLYDVRRKGHIDWSRTLRHVYFGARPSESDATK